MERFTPSFLACGITVRTTCFKSRIAGKRTSSSTTGRSIQGTQNKPCTHGGWRHTTVREGIAAEVLQVLLTKDAGDVWKDKQ